MEPTIGQSLAQTVGTPQFRSGLLQAGIALMQPTPFGQSEVGQIGQALGQGFEAADRVTQGEIDAQKAQDTQALAQQRADASTTAATSSAVRAQASQRSADAKVLEATNIGTSLTLSQRLTKQRQAKQDFDKWLEARDLNPTAATEVKADPLQLQKAIQQWQAERRGFLESLKSDPNSAPIAGAPAVPGELAPPVPGARLAPDGNWYVEQPAGSGQFFKVG